MPSQAYVPISVWKKGVSVKFHHFCSSNIYNFSSSSSPNQLPVGLHWNIATIFFVSVPEEWDLLMVLSCSQNQSIFHNSKEHGAIDTWLCTDSTAGQRWSYTVELDTSDGGVGRWTYTHTRIVPEYRLGEQNSNTTKKSIISTRMVLHCRRLVHCYHA